MSVCNYKYPIVYENATHNGKTGKMTWNTETEWFFTPNDYNDYSFYPRSQIISSMGDYGEMPQIPCSELMINALCAWDSGKVGVELTKHLDWLANQNCSKPTGPREEYLLSEPLPPKVAEAMQRGDYEPKKYRGGSRRNKSKQRKSRKSNQSKKRKSKKSIRRRR